MSAPEPIAPREVANLAPSVNPAKPGNGAGVAENGTSAPADASFTLFGDDGFSFFDLIDIINPLRHIPIVSSIYRHLTGDELDAATRVLGGALFGGEIGAVAALVNVVVDEATGKDVGDHALGFFVDEKADGGAVAAAASDADFETAGGAEELPWGEEKDLGEAMPWLAADNAAVAAVPVDLPSPAVASPKRSSGFAQAADAVFARAAADFDTAAGAGDELPWRKDERFLLIRDTPLGKAYVLGTFLTREVTDMGFKVASRVRGLSDEAFREAFGAEEQCRSALSRLRWPDGFVCPACGHRGHCVLAGRSLYQCYRCKKQTSSTAGTIFHATKLPLTLWFAAVHLIVTAKNGISSVELGRRLGVKQPTAWTMKHKIMAVMARREADTPLSGRVEMDDAYLGGARAGGKRGRGAPGKTPFVAAVSTSPEGRPRKVKLVPVKGFRKREIARGAKRWLAPGSEVLTDGLRCWNALDGVVGSHRAIRTGSGRQAARMAPFKWVNTTLGNIKSAITGTYRKLGPDHAQRYLASFAWRYNRATSSTP